LPWEQVNGTQSRRHSSPASARRYTFGDAFCGIRGASKGASQADLLVNWGLEKDELAIYGYAENLLAAEHLHMDAHKFPAVAR
jgi:DNA (cytosine-5)-methyltransferase 1